MNIQLTLISVTLLVSFLSFSQDKIILDDGRVKTIKILSITDSIMTTAWPLEDKRRTILLDNVVEYQYNGVWYTKDLQTKKFEVDSVPSYTTYKSEFRGASKFEKQRFGVSMSYGQPIFATTIYDKTMKYFAVNPRISIEPEIRVSNWFSLKLPVVFGLGVEDAYQEATNVVNQNCYWYNPNYFNPNEPKEHCGVLHYYESYNNAIEPVYMEKSWRRYGLRSDLDFHTKELIFQVGIAPKFYPFAFRKLKFYVSPSVSYGKGNYNTVDYYANFTSDTQLNYANVPVQVWELTGEDMVSKPNQFSYWRVEVLAGMEFNVTKSIGFSFEMGYSSFELSAKVSEEDHVFISINGGEPVLSHTYKFNPRNYWNGIIEGIFINRFLLTYNFGGTKN